MPRMLNCQQPALAGLFHIPAGGSEACVSAACRDGPPDFQNIGGPSSNKWSDGVREYPLLKL